MSHFVEFSVVIPTYNRLNLLKQAVSSVWAQTHTDYEIIVADDGSTDGTVEWLAAQGERVRAITQANRGPGAARNLGTREARGKYVAFLDSDDVWPSWTLETFVGLICKHNSPAILAGRMVEFRQERELDAIRPETVCANFYRDYFASCRAGYFVGAGMAVLRRDVLLTSGGFIEERVNAEDHDLIFRLGTARGFVQVLAPTTLAWRRHAASETAAYGRTFAGILRMVERERRAVYPGGASRMRERRDILTRHARPVTLSCLQQGMQAEAWTLYRATFAWNASLRRVKYLAAFPMWAAMPRLLGASPQTVGATKIVQSDNSLEKT
jgi:glycosyltransferase involved in cell wall biosynthesis